MTGTARVLDGKATAKTIREEVAQGCAHLEESRARLRQALEAQLNRTLR